MKEVEQIGDGRSETLDPSAVDLANGFEHIALASAANARVQQAAERLLIFGVLVDVRNAQLRLPQKCMIGAFEYLPLLGNGADDRFQGGTAIGVAKHALRDLRNHLLYATADRAKVLEPLVPQEPVLVGAVGIVPPLVNQRKNRI